MDAVEVEIEIEKRDKAESAPETFILFVYFTVVGASGFGGDGRRYREIDFFDTTGRITVLILFHEFRQKNAQVCPLAPSWVMVVHIVLLEALSMYISPEFG